MESFKKKLNELQTIITKMPLEACCIDVVPEFGLKWGDVFQLVRNARLPLIPSSVAQVLCRHAAKELPPEKLEDILGILRLKLVATQTRTWHVITLLEPAADEPVTELLRVLPRQVLQALRNGKNRNMRPEVQSITLGDLMYFSIQLESEVKEGSVLYMCTPPGEPVALVTSVANKGILKACVEGLGYRRYENAQLHGKDISSLLRISNPGWTANADHLSSIPQYAPTPTILPNGVDYTNKHYNENYVENLIGPNPPLLTDLNIKSTRMFFDRTRLNKTINLSVKIISEDVAKTLKHWATIGALAPTSGLFQIFHRVKSNEVEYKMDSD